MSQAADVLAALKRGETLTPLEALRKIGTLRLGARIWDLRRDGHQIETERFHDKRTGKTYARYRMKGRG